MQSVRRRRWKGAGANGDRAGGRTSGQDWSHKGNTQDTRLLSQLRPWTLQTENRFLIRGIISITRETLRTKFLFAEKVDTNAYKEGKPL